MTSSPRRRPPRWAGWDARSKRRWQRSHASTLTSGATHRPPTHGNCATLVAEASAALWHFVVQREACGLRDLRYVLRDYRVPNEVAARMGALPDERTKPRNVKRRF